MSRYFLLGLYPVIICRFFHSCHELLELKFSSTFFLNFLFSFIFPLIFLCNIFTPAAFTDLCISCLCVKDKTKVRGDFWHDFRKARWERWCRWNCDLRVINAWKKGIFCDIWGYCIHCLIKGWVGIKESIPICASWAASTVHVLTCRDTGWNRPGQSNWVRTYSFLFLHGLVNYLCSNFCISCWWEVIKIQWNFWGK